MDRHTPKTDGTFSAKTDQEYHPSTAGQSPKPDQLFPDERPERANQQQYWLSGFHMKGNTPEPQQDWKSAFHMNYDGDTPHKAGLNMPNNNTTNPPLDKHDPDYWDKYFAAFGW